MLAGVQLSDGLKLEAIADGGFSYAEIPYEIIEKDELPTYKKKDGDSRVLKVSGFSYPLAKLTPDKMYELLENCRRYQGNYIVLDTMNCEAGILENVVEECSMMMTDYRIPVFIENGCNGSDETGYLNNAYSDISSLKSIAEYCNRLCDTAIVGISMSPIMMIFTKNSKGLIATLFLTVSVIYTHRENIKRLLSGTERKLGEKK